MPRFRERYIFGDNVVIGNTLTFDGSLSEATDNRRLQIESALRDNESVVIIGNTSAQIFNPHNLQVLDITQID